MLEPWIIEQIRRREEEERRRNERPQLEVPLHDERWKRPAQRTRTKKTAKTRKKASAASS